LKRLSAGQKRRIGDLAVVWASDPPDYLPNEWDLYGVAQVIADGTHLQDAIELMKAEIQDYPAWVPAYRYLGNLYERAGEKQLAIQTFERLLTLQPGDKEAIDSLQQLLHAGEPHSRQ
jgi:tetratricopeptide (TPR) repeat protein